MSGCQAVRELLALSAAGLLDAADERRLAEHARECPECAAELSSLNEIATNLGRLPVEAPPDGLVLRTQLMVAAEADRRVGGRMAVGAAALAWAVSIATWEMARVIGGVSPTWIWAAWAVAVGAVGAAATAMLAVRRSAKGANPL